MNQSVPNHEQPAPMPRGEIRAAGSLALIFFLRMLGLFMILPVLALHGDSLAGATPLLIGLALGAYGITQACLQVPFGMASDRYGRKPVIATGLLIFAIGSIVAAVSDSITGVIIGRVLQGGGAIAAAVMALAADLTSPAHRSKAMAIIGVTIGFAFMAAFILGPLLNGLFGLGGVFWCSALLAVVALSALHWLVPSAKPNQPSDREQFTIGALQEILTPALLRANFGIFSLHAILTANFVVTPLLVRDVVGLAAEQHWMVYLPVLVVSVLLMAPFLRIADRSSDMRGLFSGAIAMLMLAQLGLGLRNSHSTDVLVLVTLFFAAFNLLEASLPALVSRIAPQAHKGAALGVYSTSQFLGAFCGGLTGGWLLGRYSASAVFMFGAIAAALWLLTFVPKLPVGDLSEATE